jgi:hypothetical protein
MRFAKLMHCGWNERLMEYVALDHYYHYCPSVLSMLPRQGDIDRDFLLAIVRFRINDMTIRVKLVELRSSGGRFRLRLSAARELSGQ